MLRKSPNVLSLGDVVTHRTAGFLDMPCVIRALGAHGVTVQWSDGTHSNVSYGTLS